MDVRLPKLGEGADSGAVVNLAVKEGDVITKGQTILELENEKAVAAIPSPADGKIVKIRVKLGDKISVGQVILTLAAEGAATEATPKPKTAHAKSAAPQPAEEPEETEEAPADLAPDEPAQPPRAIAAAPSIRRIARDLGLDLSKIRGSERGGRIILPDLRHYIQRLQKLAETQSAKAKAPASEPLDFSKWGPIHKKPATSLRKTISQRMLDSWTTLPHVTQFDEADITPILELRKRYAGAYEKSGVRLTVTSFALKAVVETLRKHPIFNSSYDERTEEIVFKDYFHLGIAVDTEAGLIVPVIRDVDKKNLADISRDLALLAEKARDRKLSLDELKGGSFTISNQGGIGGAHFTPIINKPEVAILGLGRGVLKPVVRAQQIIPRTLLPLCLSYDHRVIDGGQAARFIADLVQSLESFPEDTVRL